jgi:UDP-N-acetylmuramoyl-tripeptide--D-alanyl-D-alanine ligase
MAFAALAKYYLKLLPNIKVIAITGSVGKTLTQNAIYSVLSQKYRVVVGDENLDPTFRIPKTILAARPWHDYLILEYGVEHPGDMDYYLSLAKPKIAVLTKIASTHLKYFKNEEGVFGEKSKLIAALSAYSTAFLNTDDHYSKKLLPKTKARIIWFGQNAKGSVKISHFIQNAQGSKFRLHYKGQKATVFWKIIGKHHLLSAYSAATVGIESGLTIKQIARGLSETKVPAHRLNAVTLHNFTILDDTYNSSPQAANEAIDTLLDLGRRRKKLAVFGEMKDLGNLSQKAHKDLGIKIAKSNINYLITVGKVAKIISNWAKSSNFPGKAVNVENIRQAVDLVKKTSHKNSFILVKGSRHAHLERFVLAISGKPTKITCYHCGNLN